MNSENVTETESSEVVEPQPARVVDDRLIDELVSRAQAEGLQLTGVDEMVVSLSAKGLTTGEVQAHLAEV